MSGGATPRATLPNVYHPSCSAIAPCSAFWQAGEAVTDGAHGGIEGAAQIASVTAAPVDLFAIQRIVWGRASDSQHTPCPACRTAACLSRRTATRS